MTAKILRRQSLCATFSELATTLCFIGFQAAADSVDMRNGDRFTGQVVNVDARTVTLQNPNLGVVRLPRTNVLQISFEQVERSLPAAAKSPPAPVILTNSVASLANQLQTEGVDPKLKQQIQAQFLSAAGPEANAKFDSMLQGLLSGTMSMGDLRAEARSAANQIREMRKQVGGEGGEVLEGYLEVLDGFLRESPADEPVKTPRTGKPTPPTPPTVPAKPRSAD